MSGEQPVTEDDLHAYIDDALDFSRRRQVEAFLDQNPDARQPRRNLCETARRPSRRLGALCPGANSLSSRPDGIDRAKTPASAILAATGGGCGVDFRRRRR